MKEISRRNFIPAVGALLVAPAFLSVTSDDDIIERTLLRPKALKLGDTIGLCASAGATHDQSENDNFIQLLKSKGFKVKEGINIRKKFGYFSASDELRAKEFMDMVLDDSVSAIFFTRGGWGCARILEHLDFEVIRQHPKIILGFSDISALLNSITAKSGLTTFHGPNGNATWNDYSWDWIQKLLMQGKKIQYKYPSADLVDTPPETIVPGVASGELYGGNLTVLSNLLGSEYCPDWNGKILFLEEVLEEPYSIDRMLTQLKLNGVFEKINGIVLGQFKKCLAEEPLWSFTLAEVFRQHFENLNKPVFSGAPIGHIRNKYTVPVGEKVTINADLFTITLERPSVIL